MLTLALFLGLPITAPIEDALATINPELRHLFISDHPESYLKEVTFEGGLYLGKVLGEKVTLDELQLLEQNILSILNKLLPFQLEGDLPLVLFAFLSSQI